MLLEGLPVDLDQVRSKLELYFKNKRKSGGEVVQIREHPEDKRKAWLVYLLQTGSPLLLTLILNQEKL